MFLSIVYENRPGGCRGRLTDLKNAGRTGSTLCLTVPYDIVQPTQIEGDSNICVAAIIVEDVTVGVTAAVIATVAAEMETETAMEMETEIMETAAAAETAGIPAPASATGLTAEAITTAIGQAIMMPPLAEESPERRKRQRRELAAAARTKECGCGRGGQRLS